MCTLILVEPEASPVVMNVGARNAFFNNPCLTSCTGQPKKV